MAKVIKIEEIVTWPCEEKKQLLAVIGKPVNELTEDEWDILLKHCESCETCKQNGKVADFIIGRDMRNTLAGLADEMEKKFSLKKHTITN